LPDHIKDKIQKALGTAASKALLTHCRREIFQAAWLILIQDPEFLDAYINGIVVVCIDGIKRRLFPRFFVYSADYPEKYIFLSALCLNSHIPGLRSRPSEISGHSHAHDAWFLRTRFLKLARKKTGVPVRSWVGRTPLNDKAWLIRPERTYTSMGMRFRGILSMGS